MRIKLFTFRYSATLGGFDDEPLSSFIRDKEVLSFREHFFCVNEVPHLACVLTWQDALVGRMEPDTIGHSSSESPSRGRASTNDATTRQKGSRPDPTAALDETQRALFNTLRDWRLVKAHEEGVPPYLVFTNRQLVQVIQTRPDNPSALSSLKGIGTGKVKRYGSELIALIQPLPTEATSETPSP